MDRTLTFDVLIGGLTSRLAPGWVTMAARAASIARSARSRMSSTTPTAHSCARVDVDFICQLKNQVDLKKNGLLKIKMVSETIKHNL